MPDRPHLSLRTTAAGTAAAVVVALTLTACAGNVRVPDPAPTGTAAQVCGALMPNLPGTVLDSNRRTVTPGRFSAAWGKPPISLRCGVDRPPGLTPASDCFEVNGVGWYAERAATGYLFTTIGRTAYVEVGVPSHYAPEANALVDLAAVVNAHDPLLQPCR